MSNEMNLLKERYSHEILDIQNRLNYLEQGLIAELRGAGPYGSLSNNIQKLRKELNELFSKVVNGTESSTDELFTALNENDVGGSK